MKDNFYEYDESGKTLMSYIGGKDDDLQVDIPIGVENINHGAFKGCSNIKFVNIPNTVTKIGVSAFLWLTRPCCSS